MYKNFENNNKQFKSKLVEHLNETLFIIKLTLYSSFLAVIS